MPAPYVLGVIPARGGSKRLPGKNLASLAGKPLIAYSIEAGRRARRLTRCVVSTEDPRIAEVSRRLGADVPYMRPESLARDDTPILDVLLHAVGEVERTGPPVTAVVVLQPTSPLRAPEDIDRAVALLEEKGADTVTAVSVATDHPYWCWKQEHDGRLAPFFTAREMAFDRSRLPPAMVENGAVYVVRCDVLRAGFLYGARVFPYHIDPARAVDIDYAADLALAEQRLSSPGGS
jgi:N-acylneuraminate cytidylyltransferase/CMP-N,N'-diacetyllegionaminic acid synthase